jgi:hypothetical protein
VHLAVPAYSADSSTWVIQSAKFLKRSPRTGRKDTEGQMRWQLHDLLETQTLAAQHWRERGHVWEAAST